MFTPLKARPWACGLFAAALIAAPAHALDRTWIGGNVDWVDAGANTNWNPNDEPDADDRAIFNTANTVDLGSDNTVNGLALSGGIDLLMNDFDLNVDGLVEAVDSGTNLFISGAASRLRANNVTINNAADIELVGGQLDVHDFTLALGLLDINLGGELLGNGAVNLSEPPAVVTTLLVNDGAITAQSTPLVIFGVPPVGTLSINAPNAGGLGRVDLDGVGEAGVVNVNRNQTLDLNVAFADSFNGTLNLAHNSSFNSLNAWTLAGGSIIANNGFIDGVLPNPDVPADASFIQGGLLTQTGGTINVPDTDGTLQMDVNFTMTSGSFTNFGTVIFNGTTNITAPSGYAPSSLDAQTIVNANVTINHPASDFNWDGNGAADTTVNGSALLSLNVNRVDTSDNVFGGAINLNDNADLSVNTALNEWQMAGTLNKNSVGTSSINGDKAVLNGIVNVNAGTLDVNANLELTNSTVLNVAVGAALTASTTTIVGGNHDIDGSLTIGPLTTSTTPVVFNGMGSTQFTSTSSITVNTTVNTPAFDWDGIGTGTSHTIGSGVVFTINSATLDSDGDMDDPLNLAGSGSQLIVNSTSGLTQWTMNGITTANAAGVGTATLGGTSRIVVANVVNVDGNTNISAPVTFNGTGFVADIDAGMTLDVTGSFATYADGTIDGAGTFDPAFSNTVTGDFTINADRFDFDGGTWTIQEGAVLTFNSATDYEPDSVTNSFESMITLNNGGVFASVADPTFVMNGTLEMNASGGFDAAEWQGDAIDIGNDAGSLDANLNVTGDGNPNSQARFFAPVTFKSDADVDVPAGAFLNLTRAVTFDTVNGANNAEFTGAGTISFVDDVNVNEAVTLNMVGGTVDLDGVDVIGDFVNIDAPLTINAATLTNFGRVNSGGGVNTLDVNNSLGTGVLTVNLDDPTAEWTLNGPGVINLFNDNTAATLLAGSDVNINGTLNIFGNVRVAARLDIAGVVNINTLGQPLRLGGGTTSDPNTIAGGSITGAGVPVLQADSGVALHGFGTLPSIDFDGASNLFADNGTLTINGTISDVARIGTADADGVLNVSGSWNTIVASFVTLDGGTIQGGDITNDTVNGISGFGAVTSRLINNTRISSGSGGTLVVQTNDNDNDWDGAGAGVLRSAGSLSVLEIRDTGAAFSFGGTVEATSGGRVFANGFALDFNPGSTIALNQGTYESTNSTDIGGTVTIAAGPDSTIKVEDNRFLTFESTSVTTLNGNLRVDNNNVGIDAGATFSGAGAFLVPDGSHLVIDNGATVNVLLVNEGALRPGNSQGIGTATVKDYVQTGTGELFVELTGTLPNQFDRILASQTAQVDGYLNIDIDEVSPGVPLDPTLGSTFDILSSTFGVSGTFDTIDYAGLPSGKTFAVSYLPNAVRLTTVVKPSFAADFDDDGDVDATDYTIWVGAYALNQLGDANGDNISDAADYTVWRDQLGSGPTLPSVAVPEPGSLSSCFLVIAIVSRVVAPRKWRI